MEYRKKPTASSSTARVSLPALPVPIPINRQIAPVQRRVKTPEAAPVTENRQPQQARAIETLTFKPTAVQRQVAAPALQAATLHTQEVQRVEGARPAIQRQVQGLTEALPPSAVENALQRQQEASAPLPLIRKPQSNTDWVTVMRQQSQQIEGRLIGSRENEHYKALQRQVAHRLSAGYKQDRRAPDVRNAEYAGHLATLQRHPMSGMVARVAMTMVSPTDRPALQRAVDDVLQREARQHAQDAQALDLHSLQRQLAELDKEARQPVWSRIQARRGAGSPLPEAVQRHLEQGLNHDLSAVRIHDDAEADKLAKAVNATAFTTGTDVFFQSGKFNPNTQTGLELLAHEVTHTVQQSKGQVGKGIDPDAGLETQARAMGQKLSRAPMVPGRGMQTSARQAARVTGALQRLAADKAAPALVQTVTAGQAPPAPIGFVWQTSDGGVLLRETPGGKVLGKVPNTTRLQLLRHDPKQGLYSVRTPSGMQGWVAESHLKVPPAALAQDANLRFYVPKAGEGIFSVVGSQYGATEFGEDARYFTNVLRAVNKAEAFRVTDPKYKGFLSGAYERAVTAMTEGRDANGVQLIEATPFWLPSPAAAKKIKAPSGSFSKGVIDTTRKTFGEAGEAALYGGLFMTGLQVGLLKSLWDAVVGLVELVKLPITVVRTIYNTIQAALQGNLLSKVQEIYTFLAGGGLKQIGQMLVDEFKAGWDNKNPLKAWEFRGQTIGYIATEILTTFIPIAGIILKAGKIGKVVSFLGGKFKWLGKAGKAAMKALDGVRIKWPPLGMSPQMVTSGGMGMAAPQQEVSLGQILRMAKTRSPAEQASRNAAQQNRLGKYIYDVKKRTDKELKADLLPAPRTGETAQAAQARVTAATAEIAFRQRYQALGKTPWRPNLKDNDATFPRAHTLDRHGASLTMQDMEDRVMGVGRWAGQPPQSFAYKWLSDDLANREIQQHVEKNWGKIREALAQGEDYKASFDAGKLVGTGFYNKNIAIPNAPRVSTKGETSWVQIIVTLDPSGKPFVVTAFPKSSFH